MLPHPGNAFCNPDTAPLGRRGARPPPPPANHDMSRREARLRQGVTSPLPQAPGIAGYVGPGRGLEQTASSRGAYGHLPPCAAAGMWCLRPAGVFVPLGRAAFPPAPGFSALKPLAR